MDTPDLLACLMLKRRRTIGQHASVALSSFSSCGLRASLIPRNTFRGFAHSADGAKSGQHELTKVTHLRKKG